MISEHALGIAMAAIGEEHLFTFMLSSPFTARNIVRDTGDVAGVQEDLQISLYLAIGFSLLTGVLLKSKWTALFGSAFGLMLYQIYKTRGNL